MLVNACPSWAPKSVKDLTESQCAIYHSRTPLLEPMSALFDNIYKTKIIPEQWKIAKIIPIFKKGIKNKIENYRPIANLCAASKIFEKLILKQIHYLESTNKLDLTGKQQHGFKRNQYTCNTIKMHHCVLY